MYAPECQSVAGNLPCEPEFRGSAVAHLPAKASAAQSPSLLSVAKGAPAYEIKFLLDEGAAREVEARLSQIMSLDPHCDAAQDNGYLIRTLYCDTSALDVYRRVGRYRRFKLRLRQYGDSPRVFLERKSKLGNKVRKRRLHVEQTELARLAETPSDWEGDWYHRQLLRHRLAPVCLLEYHRVAYFGACAEGPLRLTFDREVRGGLTGDWSLAPPAWRENLLAGQVICEFKYRGVMPAPFKAVVAALQLDPGGCSKYRHCLAAAGIAGETPTDA